MTFHVVNSDTIGTGNQINHLSTTPLLANGDVLLITEGTVVASTNSTAIDADLEEIAIRVDGTVAGAGGIVIRENDDAAVMNVIVDVSATGSIIGDGSYGVNIYNDGDPALIDGIIEVSNDGEIGSYDRAGVFIGAADTVNLTNTGHIFSYENDDFFSQAVVIYNIGSGQLYNSGLIETNSSTTSTSLSIIEDVAAVSVQLPKAGGSYSVFNSGVIKGASHSVYMEAYTSEVINEGTLIGDVIFNVSSTTGVTAELNNSGEIYGDVGFGSTEDKVANSGLIDGDVDMGDGADQFDNRGGEVTGIIEGGLGDDVYIIDSASVGTLVENASEGSDLVISYAESHTLEKNFEDLILEGTATEGRGNTEDNIIEGNDGDNVLRGFGGQDTIYGGMGDDDIRGNASKDKIWGDEGNDYLSGGRGRDTIYGGDGEDIIRGGADIDRLVGGNDSDIFVFDRDKHSTNTASDTIADFEVGVDRIDFSGIGADLTFIDNAAFSGTQGEVRLGSSGGNTMLRVDVDGDGSGDMLIIVDQVTGLTETDFIL